MPRQKNNPQYLAGNTPEPVFHLFFTVKLTPEQRSEIARTAGKAGGRGRKKVE
jgi:hypothetical protein